MSSRAFFRLGSRLNVLGWCLGWLLVLGTMSAAPSLIINAPAEISEADGVVALAVDIPVAVGTPTTITLTASSLQPTSQIVEIPAGQRRAYALFTFNDDQILQGPRQVVIRGSASGYDSVTAAVLIMDDEKATVGLVLPASIAEGGQGVARITFSKPASYAVLVLLGASRSGLSFPSAVTVPSGVTSYSVTLSAVDDTVINPDYSVELTASVDSWASQAVSKLMVVNNDARVLGLVATASVFEGTTVQNATVTIPGSLSTDLVVNLTSDDPSVVTVPAQVTIPAGLRSVTFSFSALANPAITGVRQTTLRAAATSFTFGAAVVSVQDADVASLAVTTTPAWAKIGTNLGLTVTAKNSDNLNLGGYAATGQAVWENIETGQMLGAWTDVSFAAGSAFVNLPVPNAYGLYRIRVRAGGMEALSGAIRTYRQLETVAAGMVVNPTTQDVLFTSGSSAPAGYVNTLGAIAPATGTLTASPFIGSDPRTLAVTEDGAYAYVGLWGPGQIVQYDLKTKSVVRSFTLTAGASWSSYTYYPYDIETIPGLPNSVLVGQDATGSSYNTLVNYNGGAYAGDVSFTYHSIARSRRPGLVYAFNNTDTGFDFGVATATGIDVTVQRSTASPFQSFAVTIEADGDLVVGTNGVVADGQTLLSRGKLALPSSVSNWAVAADASARRIYAADMTQGLYVFDSLSLREISRIALPTVSGQTISEIKRWGQKGVALRLSGGNILLIEHADIAPTQSPADLGVVFVGADGVMNNGQPNPFTLRVTNQGPNPAVAARVVFSAPAGVSVSNIVPSGVGATVEAATNGFIARLGNLASGESRTVSFALTPGTIAPGIANAAVISDSIDAVVANDTASLPVSVVFADQANSVNAIQLYAADVVAHPSLPRVYVSTGKGGEPSLAGQVLEIDARTGRILRSLSTGQNPRSLAITDGGEYLYVALGDVSKVLRVRLDDFSVALSIDLPTSVYTSSPIATDMVTLAGAPESIAVCLNYYGTYIIDGAVSRTNHTSVYDGDRVERGDSADVLYTYDAYTSGFEFTRNRVSASGLVQEAGAKSVFGGYSIDFASDGGLALSSTGYLVDGRTITLRGVLGGMTSSGGKPALETAKQRAYAVVSNALRSYDIKQLATIRQVALPSTSFTTRKTVRWGADGFAILQAVDYVSTGTVATGQLVLVRSDIVPAQAGENDIDLLLDSPAQSGGTVRASILTVSGRVFAAAGISSVKINGQSVGAIDALGRWSKTLTLQPGVNTLAILATTAGTSPATKTTTLSYTYAPPLPAAWLDAMFPGVSVDEALLRQDTDGDGASNLHEFVFGRDPVRADEQSWGAFASDAGGTLFAFRRPVGDWASAVALKLQLSDDLQTWRGPRENEIQWLTDGPLDESGHYRDARFRVPAAAAKVFWRLLIDTQPNPSAAGVNVPASVP